MAWEEATWPAVAGDEIQSAHFEDIRKRIFIIEHLGAGSYDLDNDFANIDSTDWVSYWTASGDHDAGVIVRYHELTCGITDFFVSCYELTEAGIKAAPPLDSEGNLHWAWEYSPNPNMYHHFDYKTNRFIVQHHNDCGAGAYPGYDYKGLAKDWLPRQTDPTEQLRPVYPADWQPQTKYIYGALVTAPTNPASSKRCLRTHTSEGSWDSDQTGTIDEVVYDLWEDYGDSNEICRRTKWVGFQKSHINKILATQWWRNWDFSTCYTELTEWINESGHFKNEPLDAGPPAQHAYNPMMCDAYLDRVIICCEMARYFMNECDGDYEESWELMYGPGTYTPDTDSAVPHWDYMGDWKWQANGSIFELCLKNTENYDWYWDASYPFIPEHIDDELGGLTAAPCGTWRRCFRYTMGRPSAVMWPGTSGLPPVNNGVTYDPKLLCVTQAVYNTIDAAFQKYYQVVDPAYIAGIPANVLTDDQKAALIWRHDPTQTITKLAGTQYEYTIEDYEIKADMLNDMRAVLKEIKYYYGGMTLTGTITGRVGDDSTFYSSSLSAFAGVAANIDSQTPGETNWDHYAALGYDIEIFGGYHPSPTIEYWRGFHYSKVNSYITVTPTVGDCPSHIITAWFRVGYKPYYPLSGSQQTFDGCNIGMGGLLTLSPSSERVADAAASNAAVKYMWLDAISFGGKGDGETDIYFTLEESWPSHDFTYPTNDAWHCDRRTLVYPYLTDVISEVDWDSYDCWERDVSWVEDLRN